MMFQRSSAQGGQQLDEAETTVSPLRRFCMAVEQVIWAASTFIVEVLLITARHDSLLTTTKLMRTLVPWLSIMSIASVCRKYVLRGMDEGPLYKKGPYYYFRERGSRVWHSMSITEGLVLMCSVLHVGTSLNISLRKHSDLAIGPIVSASILLLVVLVDVFNVDFYKGV